MAAHSEGMNGHFMGDISQTPELFQSKFNILCFYMDIRCYESEIRKVRETRAYMKQQKLLQSKKTEIISSLGNDFSKLKQAQLEHQLQETARKSDFTEHTSSHRDGLSHRQADGISSNYASDISPISISSNIDLNTDYQEEAKLIAIKIFNEYLREDAEYRINIEPVAKTNIYKKFGIFLNSGAPGGQGAAPDGKGGRELPMWPQPSDSGTKNDVSGTSDDNANSAEDLYEINEAILLKNLNQGLFAELHTLTLKELNDAFEDFKKTDDFNILREDINR